jgi:hypothetical protein
VLTGTPLENRLEELASIVEWVDDTVLEPKWRLAPWYSAHGDGRREVVGARNLGELRARLAPVLLRRVRAEVLAELPARQDTTIPVELTEPQKAAHDELIRPIAKLASIARRRPLTPAEFLRLMSLLATQRMIANGLALHEFAATWPGVRGRAPSAGVLESLNAPKLGELRELIANLVVTQGRKVVVFSQWRRMLELAAWAVSDLLAAAGKRAFFFTGQEGPRRRTQNLVDFHDEPAAGVLFLTDAGGVGLNLQRAASACTTSNYLGTPRSSSSASVAFTGSDKSGPSTSTTCSRGDRSRIGSPVSLPTSALFSRACSTGTRTSFASMAGARCRGAAGARGDGRAFDELALLSETPWFTGEARALGSAARGRARPAHRL